MKEILNNLNIHNQEIQKQLDNENYLIEKYERLIEQHSEKVNKLWNKNSIGELNGYNNIKASLPLDIEEIIKLLRGDEELLSKIRGE